MRTHREVFLASQLVWALQDGRFTLQKAVPYDDVTRDGTWRQERFRSVETGHHPPLLPLSWCL